MIITETQMKLAAVSQGIIRPMDFENTTLSEISSFAYADWHCDNEKARNWIKLEDAYNWLKENPYCDWDSRLSNDKFGFFADMMNKAIQIFKQNGLIR